MKLYYVFLLLLSSASVLAFRDEMDESFSAHMANSISRRISEEGRINIFEAPFMAVIYADISYYHIYPYSIGVIVSNRWILTTAKVLKIQSGKDMKVLVGMDDITRIQEKVQTYGYSVIQGILHDNYRLNEVYNDIAMIKVSNDIIFNDRVQTIDLMSANELQQYEYQYQNKLNLMVYNYGSKDEASKNYLKRSYLSVNTKVVDLNERLFVAAHNSLPTCYGDTGSPAILEGKLVGLLSVEYNCGLQYPNVFTGILHYHEWIFNTIHLK